MLPAPSSATPAGELNEAAVPVPSAFPRLADPARVVTIPEDVIFRIVLLPRSTTYMFPDESTARPAGPRNEADVPVPSVLPGLPDPASVVTVPSGVTFWILSRAEK